jgi:Animal haem peroxidase/RTX calcium-binding nonapeptide repeat (4 copies)
MPTVHRERGARHHHHWLGAVHRAVAVIAAMFLIAELAVVAASTVRPGRAQAATAPPGAGFTLNASDLKFILKQIKIAEHHAITESGPGAPLIGPGEFQIANPMLPYGLRTVDGSENNLQPGQNTFGAVDQKFPRLTDPVFRDAEDSDGTFGPPGSTSYKQKTGNVIDSQPRVISNLIVDQTATNPAAIEAAGNPHRTFLGEPARPCTSENPNLPEGCTPPHETLFIPNVTTDVGLSPPYNSWFTLFGQFFDHGVDLTQKSGGTVFVPLKADDPLIAGPDHIAGNDDDLDPRRRFMVLTRAQNQPGPDGILGNADDEQNATNIDTPWVDQSQTYTSHSAHQVFLREYVNNSAGKPVANGKMLRGDDGGMATWAKVKSQAATMLGFKLEDTDVANVPLVAADQYGRFLRGPNGFPQVVTPTSTVEGNPAAPVALPANVKRINHAFLDDIAHHAVPTGDKDGNPQTPANEKLDPDDDPGTDDDGIRTTYDDEMLDAHFVAGDSRVNENIGLTAVHQIFHSEHNRLVDYIEQLITDQNIDVAEWKSADGAGGWNGERIFQAARFVTEMEYQHLVFEEFARKIQPGIDPFAAGEVSAQTDVNPAIKAEFAHAVYRFGHSMLTDTVSRTNEDGNSNDLPLLDAFLNPPAYNDGGSAGPLTPEKAAGSIIMGMTDQVGNELDEFVTETLRNNLLGLPLDLPTLNMTRAREAGVPSLNNLRKQLFQSTNDSSLKPYTDWVDYGLSLKHQESVVNFMAAYGQHPTIKNATTTNAKRTAARLIYNNNPAVADTPTDAAEFVNSTGAWANTADGKSITGLDEVDLWVGGLAESQNLFGGLLGSTFNYVFEQQLTDLQNGDRFYYLHRTPGLNLRTQLEGNSFAELIMRNTDAQSLKADVFGTADCEFELANLQGTIPGLIADDPKSECDESLVLIRMADGTIRYRQTNAADPPGLNAQSTFNGTVNADKVHGGVDNDTFWGNEGNDRIEGNDGADVALGGEGNDIITDSAGDDNLKGGDGNDAIDSGPGLDLIQSGFGSDFVDGGLNANETFAGEGDDFVLSGNGSDAVEGDGGDDWQEGGNGNDLLQADNAAAFFEDLNAPGHDVLIGDGGDDDYDGEGGDDIMLAGPGTEKNAGLAGFDWVTHARDPQAADADMDLKLIEEVGGIVTTRDRYQFVEGLSGGKLDDSLKGNDVVPAPEHSLDAAGSARITGLRDLLGTDVTTFAGGDIILGGAGGDTIEGRAGDDIIDGDKWLNVQLRVPDVSTPAAGDTKLVDSMTEIRADVFAGRIDPGDIKIIRTIEAGSAGTDTAVFSGPRADYDITPNINGTLMTITHARGAATDGTDTVRNVENLRFSDDAVSTGPSATLAPDRTFASRLVNTTSPAQTVTLSNTGNAPLSIASITLPNLAGTNPGDFVISNNACGATLAAGASCNIAVTFRPTAVGTRTATLRATDNSGTAPGSTQDVTLTGIGSASPPPNNLPVGVPTINDTTPQLGQTLNAGTAGITDADGLGTFGFQWQFTANANGIGGFTNIAGATTAGFTVPNTPLAQALLALGRRYRVVVTYTDGQGHVETLSSAPTARPTVLTNQTGLAAATPATVATPLGQALAPVQRAAPAALRATALSVSAPRTSPITVAATVPPGASTVRIRVVRLSAAKRGSSAARKRVRRHMVATVYRKTPSAKRYTFRLTEPALRNLKGGRYQVEVRIGTSPSRLGPAMTRTVTVKSTKGKPAR